MNYKIRSIHLRYLDEDPRLKKLEAMKNASGLTWEAFILKATGIEA